MDKEKLSELLEKGEWEILTPLSTVKIGKELWMTLIPHQYKTPLGIIVVPAGFLFDHASVPRMFSSIIQPVKSCLAEASLLHDWFYVKDSEDIDRKIADKGLKMITENTAKWTNNKHKAVGNLAKLAVSWFASSLYNRQYFAKKYENSYSIFKDNTSLQELQEKLVLSWDIIDDFVFKI